MLLMKFLEDIDDIKRMTLTSSSLAKTNFFAFLKRRLPARAARVRETVSTKCGVLYIPSTHHYYINQKDAKKINLVSGNEVLGILEDGWLAKIATLADPDFCRPVLFNILRDENWNILLTSGTKIMPSQANGIRILEQMRTSKSTHGFEYVNVKGKYNLSRVLPWESVWRQRHVSLLINNQNHELLFFSYAERFTEEERLIIDAILFSRLAPELFELDRQAVENSPENAGSLSAERSGDEFLGLFYQQDLLKTNNLEAALSHFEQALIRNPLRLEVVPKLLETRKLLDIQQKYHARYQSLRVFLDEVLAQNYHPKEKIARLIEFFEDKKTTPLDIAAILALVFRLAGIETGLGHDASDITKNLSALYSIPRKHRIKLMTAFRILWQKGPYRAYLETYLKQNRKSSDQQLKLNARKILERLRAV